MSLKINSTAISPKFLNLRMHLDPRLVNQELQSQMVRLLNIDYFLLEVGYTSPMLPIFPRQWEDHHNGGVVHEPDNLRRGESSHLLHTAWRLQTVQRLWQREEQLWKGNYTLIQVLFLTWPPPISLIQNKSQPPSNQLTRANFVLLLANMFCQVS